MKKYISALNLILFAVFITPWCEERDGRTNSNKLKGRSRNYESNSFYQDAEAHALASLSQNCYQNYETYKGIYDEIWNNEQGLRDAADARETQGIWKTVGGVFLVVGGTVCIVASGGAATPIVAAGWTAGGGTIAFASSAFIPISQAARVGNLTFRSGVTTVAKEGIAMMAGAGASDVTMRVTGSQTASVVAGMIASGATGRGLNGVDTRFNISGNKIRSNSNNSVPYYGEEWCRYFRETYGNENVVWENATPSQLARSWQGGGRYPGIDDWKSQTYQKGDILYRGELNGTEFFTTREAIEAVGANKEALFEGLQVEPHPTLGYRSEKQGYQFKEGIEGAESLCIANTDYGAGGLVQEFVPDANALIEKGILVPVERIKLY